MNLAPILISVYTRENHFKQCIESLARNTLADQSILYIASDAGKTEKDQEMVDRIRTYVKLLTGFKEIILIAQEHNVGSSKNINSAREIIWKKYNRMIVSEDDNVFSPNFLEFMNKGLEKFEKDKSVLAINGYRHFYNIKYAENSYFMQNVDFSAWGYGIWKDRFDEVCRCKQSFFILALLNPISLFRIWRQGNRLLYYAIIFAIHWKGRFVDVTYSLYMIVKNKYVIMPVISKVRNIGFDEYANSAGYFNLQKTKKLQHIHGRQQIDTNDNFEYTGNGFNFLKENRRIYAKEDYGKMSFIDIFKKLFLLIKKKL